MASLSDILAAFQTRLETLDGMHAHGTVPDSIAQVPAAIVEWQSTDYHEAMQNGLVTHEFRVRILIATNYQPGSQEALQGYLAPSGSGSVKAALEGGTPARTLGGTVPATVVVQRAERPGIYEFAGTKFFGADWTVTVSDTGV